MVFAGCCSVSWFCFWTPLPRSNIVPGIPSCNYLPEHNRATTEDSTSHLPPMLFCRVSQIPRDPWQSSRKRSTSRSAAVFPTQSTPHPCLGYYSRVLDQDQFQIPTSFSPQKCQPIHRRLSNHRPDVARSFESMESVHSWSRTLPETSAYSFKFVLVMRERLVPQHAI